MFSLQTVVHGLFGKTISMSVASLQIVRGLSKKSNQRKLAKANEEARLQNTELQPHTVSFENRNSQNQVESNTLSLQPDNPTENTIHSPGHYPGSAFNGEIEFVPVEPANDVFGMAQRPNGEQLLSLISEEPHIFPKRISAPAAYNRKINQSFESLVSFKQKLKTCLGLPFSQPVETNSSVPGVSVQSNQIDLQMTEITESSPLSFQSRPANIVKTTWKTIPTPVKYVSTGLGCYYLGKSNGGNGGSGGNGGNGGNGGSSAGSGFPKGFLRKIQKPQITEETVEKGTTSIILPSPMAFPSTKLANNVSTESLLIILGGLVLLKITPFLIRLGTDFYNGTFTLIGDSYNALRAFLIDLYAGSRFILTEVYELLKLPFGFFRLLFYVSSIMGVLLAVTTVTSGIKPNITSVPAVSGQCENTTPKKVSGVNGKQLRTITITVFCTLVLVRLSKTPVFTNKIQVVTKVEADKVKNTDGE